MQKKNIIIVLSLIAIVTTLLVAIDLGFMRKKESWSQPYSYIKHFTCSTILNKEYSLTSAEKCCRCNSEDFISGEEYMCMPREKDWAKECSAE